MNILIEEEVQQVNVEVKQRDEISLLKNLPDTDITKEDNQGISQKIS